MINSIWVRGARKSSSFTIVTGVLAATFLMSGFFVAPNAALAAHTATVTVDPTLVKGGQSSTYTFNVTNNGPDSVIAIYIDLPAGFSAASSIACPLTWVGGQVGNQVQCAWSPGKTKLASGQSAEISFQTTAPTPVEDTVYSWVTTTWDTADTSANPTAPETTVDVTAPTITSITTKDTDADGRVDTATIVFIEPVDDSTFVLDDFTIGGVAATAINTETPDDTTFDVVVAEGVDGTEAKQITYTQGEGADLAGNLLANVDDGDVTETDEAKPVMLSAQTKTTTRIDTTWSENIDGTTVNDSGTEFTVTGFAISAADDNSDNIVELTVATMPTGATPAVTFTNSGTFKDLNGNEAVTPKTVTATDGVAPTFTAQTLTTTTIELTFSENVDGGTAANAWTIDGDPATVASDPAGGTTLTLTVATMSTGATPEVVYVAANGDIADTATATNGVADGTSGMAEDGIAPTVVISSTATSPTNTSPIPMTVTFSEDVTGFEIGDIVVVNGTKADFAAVNSSVYTFNITSPGPGAVTVDIAGGVAQDAATNGNIVAPQSSVVFDPTPPDAPTVLTPNGGEFLQGGSSYDITWTPTSDANLGATPIKIEYSALGDFSDTTMLADNEANDGTYAWNPVPSVDLATAKIRITATDLAGNSSNDVSDTAFTIDSTNPAITSSTLLTPSATNIYLQGGSIYSITWDNTAITDTNFGGTPIKIEYASDGTTFVLVAENEINDGAYTWTVPSDNIATAKIRITATDLAGNSSSDVSDNAFTVDSTVPTVDAGDDKLTNAEFTQDAETSDGGSGLATHAWTQVSGPDGGLITFGTPTVVDTTISADIDGVYVIRLTVTDNAGNENFGEMTLTWDTEEPTVDLTEDQADMIVRDADTVTITATFNEAMTSAPTITIDATTDDVTATAMTNTSGNIWTYTWNVPAGNDGLATVTVAGTDLAGNTYAGVDTLEFTIDNTAPDAEETSVVATPTSDTTPSLTITVESGVSWEIKDNATVLASGTGTGSGQVVTLSALDDGSYELELIATDEAGNDTTVPLTAFVIDTVDPVVEVGDDVLANALISKTATATDDGGSGVNAGTFQWTQEVGGTGSGILIISDPTNLTTDISAAIDGTEDGTYVISFTALDNAGNSNTDTFTLTWDTVAPTLAIVLTDPALKAGDTSLVTFTFSEAVTGFDNTDITTIENGLLSAVASGDSGITWTATFTPTADFADTTNVITVTKSGVMDMAGNAGVDMESSDNYTIDTLRSTVTAVLTDSNLIAGETTTVTFTFSEVPTDFNEADVTVESGAITGAMIATIDPLVFTATLTPTPDVEDAINILTVGTSWADPAGNAPAGGTDSLNYTVETKKPSVVLASITLNPTNGLIAVTAEFSETVTGFDDTDITVANGAVENFVAVDGDTYTFNVNPTDGASIAVTIEVSADKAIDAAGNNNTASNVLAYTSDTVAPTVDLTEDQADMIVRDADTVTITATFNEAMTSAPTITIDATTDDVTATAMTNTSGNIWTYTWNVPAGNDGLATVTVAGTDLAGNTYAGVDTLEFTIDNTAPVLTITAPLSGDKVSGDEVITFDDGEETAPECSVDDDVYVNCESGVTTLDDIVGSGFADLDQGAFTLYVRDTDAAGNVGTDSEAGIIKDTTLPSITAKTPGANAVGIDPSTNITITFNEDVLVEDADVAITPGNPAKTITFVSETGIATINPDTDLNDNTTYTITLDGVTDTAGNALPETSWSFTTAASYSIDLTTGWNLISLPVVPVDTDASAVLGDLDDVATIQSVFTYDALTGEWLVYHPDSPETSDFSTMNTGNGYWIDYLAAPTATIAGTGNLFLEGASTPPQKELAAGWNLIGYYQLEDTTDVAADLALSTLGDNWTQLRTYNNTSKGFVSPVVNMSPGQGYWIFMKSSTIGTYIYGPGDAS